MKHEIGILAYGSLLSGVGMLALERSRRVPIFATLARRVFVTNARRAFRRMSPLDDFATMSLDPTGPGPIGVSTVNTPGAIQCLLLQIPAAHVSLACLREDYPPASGLEPLLQQAADRNMELAGYLATLAGASQMSSTRYRESLAAAIGCPLPEETFAYLPWPVCVTTGADTQHALVFVRGGRFFQETQLTDDQLGVPSQRRYVAECLAGSISAGLDLQDIEESLSPVWKNAVIDDLARLAEREPNAFRQAVQTVVHTSVDEMTARLTRNGGVLK